MSDQIKKLKTTLLITSMMGIAEGLIVPVQPERHSIKGKGIRKEDPATKRKNKLAAKSRKMNRRK
ncbi:MAG: hypothetical protein AB9897_01115 [Anaerolineaceae bacterium]